MPSRFAASTLPSLDRHHTHFILVESGRTNDYGSKVPLRAQLEALACQPAGDDLENGLARHLGREGLRWEGQGPDRWASQGAAEPGGATRGVRRPRAVPLLRGRARVGQDGGGGGARQPPCARHDFHRAPADLISDCVRFYGCSRGPAAGGGDGAGDGGGEGPVVEWARLDPFDSGQVRRVVLPKRLLVFM